MLAESGVEVSFRTVATKSQLPYARHLEDAALPNVDRIVKAALSFS
ncbi:hypothetical protein BMS3Bbin01_02986 [bacterium BMS3Bbin01]|nr:hypothetical protein BMS3Bbin01_02986 [bacterium BMS3Bbin01]